MIPFDFIAEKNAQEAQHEFIRKFVEAKHEIVSFVSARLKWSQTGEFLCYFKGSFNLSIAIRNTETNERVIIRFPFWGKVYKPWRERKVRNEVNVLNYLSEFTRLPVPRVHHWGLTEESPQLGPLMIWSSWKGENLGDILKKPGNDTDPAILDPDIDKAKLNSVYEQVAGFMLELSRLEFSRIGAISKDSVSGEWTVAEPPLTYDMNEFVGFAGFPADHFTSMVPLARSSE